MLYGATKQCEIKHLCVCAVTDIDGCAALPVVPVPMNSSAGQAHIRGLYGTWNKQASLPMGEAQLQIMEPLSVDHFTP